MRPLLPLLLLPGLAWAENGLIRIESAHSAAVTAERLAKQVRAKGMKIVARIDHAQNAAVSGKRLPPTRLMIFGNPKVGTPLMLCAPTVAIDLPQKALIWRDADDRVWLAYNDPHYLKQRHGIQGCDAEIDKIAKALAGFAQAATAP